MNEEEKIKWMYRLNGEVGRAISWIYFLDFYNTNEVYDKLNKTDFLKKSKRRVKNPTMPTKTYLIKLCRKLLEASFLETPRKLNSYKSKYLPKCRLSIELFCFFIEQKAKEEGIKLKFSRREKEYLKGLFDIEGFRQFLFDLYSKKRLEFKIRTIEPEEPPMMNPLTVFIKGIIVFIDEYESIEEQFDTSNDKEIKLREEWRALDSKVFSYYRKNKYELKVHGKLVDALKLWVYREP